MLSVLNTNTDTQNAFVLDAVRLDKVVKALLFVSHHIRQTGDTELANRIDSGAYEVLLSAYKDKTSFDHISNYVYSLLSVSVSKQYMSENVVGTFRSGFQAVYSKRQPHTAQESQIKDIIGEESSGTHMYNVAKIETKIDAPLRHLAATSGDNIKKDKMANHNNVRNVSDDKRQSSRRQEILKTLSRAPVSIKDISMHVLGCSEKTIQRELNALVDDGSVERVGEKRWSKYILKR